MKNSDNSLDVTHRLFIRVLISCLISAVLGAAYATEVRDKGENKAIVCTACHGQQGNSVNPQWPNIAGQHPKYFIKQLMDMKQNQGRNASTMATIIPGLSEEDINDLAMYYAKMPLANGETPEAFVARGEALYRGGDYAKGITACIACHGPKGTGNAQAGFPVISGQHAQYTLSQLESFKEGKRANDLNHIMRDISSRMSHDDMEAIAHYIEGLH